MAIFKQPIIIFALMILGTVSANSCEPPKSHGIIDLGGTGMVPGQYTSTPLPIGGFLFVGYESPKKWSTIGVQYRGIATNEHEIGILYKLNVIPFWKSSPVNLHFLFGSGYLYKYYYLLRNNAYFNTGFELNIGQVSCPLSFFIRDEIGFETSLKYFEPELRNSISFGIHIRMGPGW